MTADLAALRQGLCDEGQEAACLDEMGEESLAWACAECSKIRRDDLEPYTLKLLHLAALQKGGYPLDADELSLEEWIDLGRIKEALKPPVTCPLLTRHE